LSAHIQIRLYKVEGGEKNGSCIRYALGSLEDSFNDDDLLLLKKGAPDILLAGCSSALATDGTVVPLDAAIHARISQVQEDWAARGQRVLLLARKILKAGGSDIPASMNFDHAHFADTIIEVAKKDLTVIGMVGIVVRIFSIWI
jgi:sodium/potassium-transporting ATPase subunit alpha